jgi:predicted flap endonuclease-1-like 5' DNA nuclease
MKSNALVNNVAVQHEYCAVQQIMVNGRNFNQRPPPMTHVIHSYNEETIRALAHQNWIDEGKPDGRAEIHWQWALASLTASAERPVAKAKANVADDISLIDGIGPKITKQLAAEGITTFAHLAALSEKAMAALDQKLGLKGRSARDEWTTQAKELLAGQAPRAKIDQAKASKSK